MCDRLQGQQLASKAEVAEAALVSAGGLKARKSHGRDKAIDLACRGRKSSLLRLAKVVQHQPPRFNRSLQHLVRHKGDCPGFC